MARRPLVRIVVTVSADARGGLVIAHEVAERRDVVARREGLDAHDAEMVETQLAGVQVLAARYVERTMGQRSKTLTFNAGRRRRIRS